MWPFGNSNNNTVERANEIASGKSSEPVAKAEDIYLSCIKSNQPKAKSSLGFHYAFGTFGKGRVAEGVALLNQAITDGDDSAYSHLGLVHAKGLLGKVDYRSAMQCYQKAADGGCGASAFNIGVMLMKGQGCEVDLQSARDSFERSLNLGVESAANRVSLCDGIIAEIRNNVALYGQMGKPYVPSFKSKEQAIYEIECLKSYIDDDEYIKILNIAKSTNSVGVGHMSKWQEISMHINNLSFHTGISRDNITQWIIDGDFLLVEEAIIRNWSE